MNKRTKILRLLGYSALLAGVLTLLGFVGNLRSSASCELVEVRFSDNNQGLVTEPDVRNLIEDNVGIVVGVPLNEIHTREIEESLEAMNHVREVKVYKTIDKALVVSLEERIPMARLIDKTGKMAWLDKEGYILPLSGHAALRLPVITGNFSVELPAVNSDLHCTDTLLQPVIAGIYQYASAIDKSEFWKAQIQQTYVNAQGDFIAVPQVGKHEINFGTAEEMDYKLQMLKTFYDEGLKGANWNKYTLINLKYKDQIVCTKK